MKKISNSQKGFTLVELLAVIFVLMAVGTIVGAILVSTLRGTNKTNTIAVVRQNGNFAIMQMVKMLRFAKTLNKTFVCGTLEVPVATDAVELTFFDDSKTTFSCNNSLDTPPNTITSNSASLLDTTSVSLVSCSFTCSQASLSDLSIIGINFSLSAYAPTGVNLLPEKTASATAIPFQTSVTMRNLNR